jgi:hypothetical protein
MKMYINPKQPPIHVLPIDDLKPHEEEGLNCECKPTIQGEGETLIVIHNAYDGRK